MTKLLRKTQQPSEFADNQIHDAYSSSTTDTYSCDYINNKLGDPQSWETLSLLVGSATFPLRITKRNGIVNVNGVLTGITGTQQIATIPEGYRPSSQIVAVASNTNIQINTDGAMYTLNATNNSLGINITYFIH